MKSGVNIWFSLHFRLFYQILKLKKNYSRIWSEEIRVKTNVWTSWFHFTWTKVLFLCPPTAFLIEILFLFQVITSADNYLEAKKVWLTFFILQNWTEQNSQLVHFHMQLKQKLCNLNSIFKSIVRVPWWTFKNNDSFGR